MDIDSRIKAIEDRVNASIPSTMITRALMPSPGDRIGWRLEISRPGMPIDFFHALTIDGCLTMAEIMLRIPRTREGR